MYMGGRAPILEWRDHCSPTWPARPTRRRGLSQVSSHAGGVLAHRSTRRTIGAGAVAVLVSLVITTTTFAANVGPTQVLRQVSAEEPLFVSDVAGKGKNIATAWSENFRPYLRWSTNGGATFHSSVSANGTYGARIDICGGFVWALAVEGPVAPDEGVPLSELNVHVDSWSLDATTHRQRAMPQGTGYGDIACIGDRAIATVWERVVGDSQHLSLQIWAISGNGRLTQAHAFDLGATNKIVDASVAATNTSAHVAWMDGRNVRLKTIDLGPGAVPSAVAHPTTTVTTFDRDNAGRPMLAADGSRVILAYYFKAQVRVRISEDRADSFGDYAILKRLPAHTEGYVYPTSIDASAGRILVETVSGCCAGIESQGFRSSDHGATWHGTFSQESGYQDGALIGSQASPKFAEAWDNAGLFPDPAKHKIRFHTGTAS
jgi:hypothetical protein